VENFSRNNFQTIDRTVCRHLHTHLWRDLDHLIARFAHALAVPTLPTTSPRG
jgi:hypothetical protein